MTSRTRAESDRSETRSRQSVISFRNGQLATTAPSSGPVHYKDPRRVNLRAVAKETLRLLPGLLATRPDVRQDCELFKNVKADVDRSPNLPQTPVRVINADTIDAALDLQHNSVAPLPVCILNMANEDDIGGGFLNGAMAQEECLCYRSSLFLTLYSGERYYPIADTYTLYSPHILVIRDGDFDLLDFRNPSNLDVLSVVSAAAICRPRLTKSVAKGTLTYRDTRDALLTMEKMRAILRCVISKGHRQVVLGAFGCGAFGNPNDVVADMWANVLQEIEFACGWWNDVIFAVLDKTTLPDGNFEVFRHRLDGVLV